MTDKKQLKAAGYVRVSSTGQVDNESLSTQRQSIKDFCKSNNYKLTQIYADEGISGGTVKERHALLQALHDAQKGKFDILVIHRLSRFGRNARELLNNHHELRQVGIQLRSIKEGIDFGTRLGKFILQTLANVDELEREIIKEQMYENRVAKAMRGIPTANLPFGRTFDQKTGKWGLDSEAERLIPWAADQYLAGESLRDIAHTLRTRYGWSMSYQYLIKVLTERSGDTWTINFKEAEKSKTFNIPPLLDDETIQRIKDRLEHNKTNNRTDVRKYVLTGFIRCEACKKTLYGQIQQEKYKYYRHVGGKYEECDAFHTVPLEQIEQAVFQTIFENIADVPSFQKAIKESLPDAKLIRSLEKEIKAGEKQLKRLDKDIDKLVDSVLDGTLDKSTIREREQTLLQAKSRLSEDLEQKRQHLDSLPDLDEIKQEAEDIRRDLLRKYSGEDRLKEMTYEDKKALLHWLFDGKAPNGEPYGIYVNKKGTGKSAEIDYFMFGRITGLRTLKGDDINYYPEDDENDEDYKTNKQKLITDN